MLEWIRRHDKFRALPVAVLTSSLNPHDEVRTLELGATFHTKPAGLEELGHVVREIVQQWTP